MGASCSRQDERSSKVSFANKRTSSTLDSGEANNNSTHELGISVPLVTYVTAMKQDEIPSGTVLSRVAWEKEMHALGRLVIEDRQFHIGGYCRSVPLIKQIQDSSIMQRRNTNQY
jgi:hypothetical protein